MAAKQVIALYSPAPQSGKSTVAEMIRSVLWSNNKSCIVYSFASPIKKMLYILLEELGIKDAEDRVYGNKKEEPIKLLGSKNPRYIMQTLGTEWGRQLIHDRLWINIMINKIKESPNHTIIIDDMRFPNEKAALEALDALCINVFFYKIIRPGSDYTPNHASEGSMDDLLFDEVIINDGSISDLRKKVEKILGV